MFNSTHPARQARRAAGIVGATAYVGLVWIISSEAESSASIDLSASLGATGDLVNQAGSGLDLSGGATATSEAIATPLDDPGSVTGADPADNTAADGTTVAPSATTASTAAQQSSSTTAGASSTSSTAAGASTTAPPTSGASTTQPPTTQPPSSQPSSTVATTTTIAVTTTAAPTTTTTMPTTTTTSKGS